MVVFCPNMGVLSAAVLALVPLMRPFAWQSLLLPVLPVQEKMLDLLEAPVPFIFGIKARHPLSLSLSRTLQRAHKRAMPMLPLQGKS